MQTAVTYSVQNVLKRDVYDPPKYPAIGIALISFSAVAIVFGALSLHKILVKGSPFAFVAKAIPLPAQGAMLGVGVATFGLGIFFCVGKKTEALVVDPKKAKVNAEDLTVYNFQKKSILEHEEAEDLIEALDVSKKLSRQLFEESREASFESLGRIIDEGCYALSDLREVLERGRVQLADWRAKIVGEYVALGHKPKAFTLPEEYQGIEADKYRDFYSLVMGANRFIKNEVQRLNEWSVIRKNMDKLERWLDVSKRDPQLELEDICSYLDGCLDDISDKFELDDINEENALLLLKSVHQFREDFDLHYLTARAELRRFCRIIENIHKLEPLNFQNGIYATPLEDYYLEGELEEKFELYTSGVDQLIEMRDRADELNQKEKILSQALILSHEDLKCKWDHIANSIQRKIELISKRVGVVDKEILYDHLNDVWIDLMALRKHLEICQGHKGFEEWQKLELLEGNEKHQKFVRAFNALANQYFEVEAKL
jgi:hypothetical protein